MLVRKFLWVLFLSSVLLAQEFIRFDRIGSERGLSVNSINSIVQDKTGFIWIATEDGLHRFDGYSFKVFRKSTSESNTITSNNILKLAVNETGKIVILSINNIDILDPVTEDFTQITDNKSIANSSELKNLNSMTIDSLGNIWIAAKKGLLKLDLKSKKVTHFEKETELASVYINNLHLASSGDLWISSQKGLNSFNFKTNELKTVPLNFLKNDQNDVSSAVDDADGNIWFILNYGLHYYNILNDKVINRSLDINLYKNLSPNVKLSTLYKEKNSRIWLGSLTQGLFSLDLLDNDSRNFDSYRNEESNPNSLSGDQIQTIFTDRSGLVWIGTISAAITKIRYAREGHFKHIRKTSSSNSLGNNNQSAIFEDVQNTMWFGSVNGGMTRYLPKERSYKAYTFSENSNSILSNSVSGFGEDEYGNFYIGTDRGISIMDRVKQRFTTMRLPSAVSESVTYLVSDSRYRIWVGTINGLSLYTPGRSNWKTWHKIADNSNSLVNDEVTYITEDLSKNIWIGTRDGLSKYNEESDTFTNFKNDRNDNKSLSDNVVLSIYAGDAKNGISTRIWVGTENGLNRFEASDKSFKRFGLDEGLPNVIIYGVIEDADRNVWISSNKGLTKLENEEKVTNYTVDDGLQSNKFNMLSFFQNSRGKLYFGGSNGLTEFNPKRMLLNQNRPIVAISDIKINYENYKLDSTFLNSKTLQLSYDQSTITFDFSALEYTISSRNKYSVVLVGFNNDASIDLGNRNTINYSNLNPKEYILRVNAWNNDGIEARKRFELKIVIEPPYFKTLWFQISVILLIVLIISTIFYILNSNAKKREALLDSQVDRRTRELMFKTKELQVVNEDLKNENKIRQEAEEALLHARAETDSILENVKDGLFLLNRNFEVSEQHSNELEIILETKNLSRHKLSNLLKPHVTQKTLEALSDYCELLYNEDIDEEVVNELNPISETELYFEKQDGTFKSKQLEFVFRRIVKDEEIINLMVTVRDLTRVHQLKKQLEESEESKKYEMEQLLSILSIDPNVLRNFLSTVDQALTEITRIFEEDKKDYTDALVDTFRTFHNLKGNAGLLNLRFFVEKFHKTEGTIKILQQQRKLTGDDFLPIILDINDINNYVAGMHNLIDRILVMSQQIQVKQQNTEQERLLVDNINDIVEKMSKKLGKSVRFIYENTDSTVIPDRYMNSFKDIIIQLVKNSIVHGIETTQERLFISKNPEGIIKLSLVTAGGYFQFKYRDDGKGLNIEALKEKGIIAGLLDRDKVDQMRNNDIARIIFQDGFSTANETDEFAGRGVGMSLVKDLVTKNNGKIKFSYSTGKFFELGIDLPIA